MTSYHMDSLGSVVASTNGSQQQTGDMRYDAFGQESAYINSTTTFGWNGKSQYQTDVESGLVLLGHRYYDPSTGRFISQDPAQDESNWYAYCGNNPLTGVDPSGMRERTQVELKDYKQLVAIMQSAVPGTAKFQDVMMAYADVLNSLGYTQLAIQEAVVKAGIQVGLDHAIPGIECHAVARYISAGLTGIGVNNAVVYFEKSGPIFDSKSGKTVSPSGEHVAVRVLGTYYDKFTGKRGETTMKYDERMKLVSLSTEANGNIWVTTHGLPDLTFLQMRK